MGPLCLDSIGEWHAVFGETRKKSPRNPPGTRPKTLPRTLPQSPPNLLSRRRGNKIIASKDQTLMWRFQKALGTFYYLGLYGVLGVPGTPSGAEAAVPRPRPTARFLAPKSSSSRT